MSSSGVEASCTSAAANDAVRHVGAATTRLFEAALRTSNVDMRQDAWFEIVGPDVLLDFQLYLVPTRSQTRRSKRALHAKRSFGQAGRPVAVDVHAARKQRAVTSADRDHEHGFGQTLQGAPN